MAQERPKTTPIGRLSFAHLFRPSGFQDAKPKYSCMLIFDEGTDLSEMKAEAIRVAREKFGDRYDRVKKKLTSPFRDGEEKDHLDGFEKGKTFITFKSDSMPKVVDNNRLLLDESDMGNRIYAGCYVRVSYKAFAYDRNGNQGVSFGLQNVLLVRDGEPLTGAAPSDPMDDFAEDFEAEEASYTAPPDTSEGDIW